MNRIHRTSGTFIKRMLLILPVVFYLIYFNTRADELESPFHDIGHSFAEAQILSLQQQGIVTGNGNGSFRPKDAVTRAEFVTLLARTLRIEPIEGRIPAFSDVPANSWSYKWIQAGTILGIIKGKSHLSFAPNEPVTRQEAATLFVRGIKANVDLTERNSTIKYSDKADISNWAAPYVSKVSGLGLMSGYEGRFRPNSSLTREEMAVVLDNLLKRDPASSPVSASLPMIHLGWEYLDKNAFREKIESSGMLNTVSPRWFFLDKSGIISDQGDPAFIEWAKKKNLSTWALVGNRFDSAATHQMLSDESKTSVNIERLVEYARKYRLEGIQIDFENINPKDRDLFTDFISRLSDKLESANVKLSVCVPPDLGTDWSEPYDYRALGQHANYIILMGYDEHWNGGPRAGSVSSYSWLERGVDQLIAEVPAHKVIVGLPLYTRDWYSANGKIQSADKTISEQMNILKQKRPLIVWNPLVGQFVATYSENGVKHSIWLEDGRSLALKYQMLLQKKVAGTAFWYVGRETDEIWETLRSVDKFYR